MLVNIIVLFNDSEEGEKEFVTNNFSQYFKECTERRLLYKSVNKLMKTSTTGVLVMLHTWGWIVNRGIVSIQSGSHGSHDSKPYHSAEACVTWSCEPYHAEPPKADRSQCRALTKCGPLEEEMAIHFCILPVRPQEKYETAKR